MAVQTHNNLLPGSIHGKRKHSVLAESSAFCNIHYERGTADFLAENLLQLHSTPGFDASNNQNDINIVGIVNDPYQSIFNPGSEKKLNSLEQYSIFDVVSSRGGLICNSTDIIDPSYHQEFMNHGSTMSLFNPARKKLRHHSFDAIYNVADTSDLSRITPSNPGTILLCQDVDVNVNVNVSSGLISHPFTTMATNHQSWNINTNNIAENNLFVSQTASLFNTGTKQVSPENEAQLFFSSNGDHHNTMDTMGTDYSSMVLSSHDRMEVTAQQCNSNILYNNIPSDHHDIGRHIPFNVAVSDSMPSLSNSSNCNGMGSIQAQFIKQDQEIRQVLKLYEERMRQSLEEQSERHMRSLLASMAQCMVMCSIKEKEAEIAEVCNRNVELQNLVKQLSFESQVWQTVACRDEATIESLKSQLTQISTVAESKNRRVSTKEGSGESYYVEGMESQCIHNVIGREEWEENDGTTKSLKEDDLEHLLIGGNMRDERNYCRICRSNSVCILLLPCKHLCLCKECDHIQKECPLCGETKRDSVQVYME